jgi:hypothetical protein
VLFDEMLSQRLSEAGELRALDEKSGFYADPVSRAIRSASQSPPADHPVSWLASERLAKAWQDVIAGHNVVTNPEP